MLTHPTLDQLRALQARRHGRRLRRTADRRTVPRISHLPNGWRCCSIARRPHRGTQRFKSRLRNAKLRHGQASIEDVDYRTPRRLDKALFQQLAAGRWIAEHRNLLVTGPCGVGKSWLSLRAGAESLPRRLHRALRARAAPVRRSRTGAR